MKKIVLLLSLAALFSFTGCFQILHHLSLNDDGAIDVYWQFDISRSLAEMNKKQPQKPDAEKKEDIFEKMDETKGELMEQLKGKVTDLKLSKIDDEYIVGIAISFKAKKYFDPKTKDDEFTIMPAYDKKKNTLTFYFNLKDDKKDEQKKEKKDNKGQQSALGMEEIMNAVMSSARYQLILGGEYNPVKAVVKGNTTGKTYKVNVTKLGTQYMINIPFMSISMKEKKGFELIVYLK